MDTFKRRLVMAGVLLSVLAVHGVRAAGWPDLSLPPKASGGGEQDAAVIVAAQDYVFVPKVPGARLNAAAWHTYLTETLQVPLDRVALLENNDATLEKIRKHAARAASEAQPGGTLWFVFIGHGAPAKDGKDGVLVGADAQQDAESLYARSLRRGELLGLLAQGRQARTVVLLDACFSGRTAEGAALVPGLQPLVTVVARPDQDAGRTILLSAARSDQFAGPLPKSSAARPAFSYLALGALRGWAADAQGRVTAGALVEFARKALTLAKGRTQTPQLVLGAAAAVLARGSEAGPDLARIDRGGTDGPDFSVTADQPELRDVETPGELGKEDSSGPDFRGLDLKALKGYDEAVKTDKSDEEPGRKAVAWHRLAQEVPALSDRAEKRARQWERFSVAQWNAQEARRKRSAARDKDWRTLAQLLAMDADVVPESRKTRWAEEFRRAYRSSPGLEPEMSAQLDKHLPRPAAPAEAQAGPAETGPASGSSAASVPSASPGDIAAWKEDEKDCAKCCADVGGSWRWGSYAGDRYGTPAQRDDFWGCCSGGDFLSTYASCRAAGRGIYRDTGQEWFRCARP